MAPLAVATLIVVGVAFPHQWLGLVDHCFDHPGHLHLCYVHGAPMPDLLVLCVGLLAAAWSVSRLCVSIAKAWRAVRALRRVLSAARLEGELWVLPGQVPMAFTVGLLSPLIIVSEAVASTSGRWRAVLEHERSHAESRDPLVRWLAETLTAFHAPGVGADLVSRLRDAQELAADERAADAIGCRIRVAETLVEWMRWSHAARESGVGFHSGPFALRVRRLLDPETYRSGPSGSRLLFAVGALVGVVALIALPLHHAVETVFGFLLS
ncbi:MAG: M56 family metallopeptidase [Sandaracinaceae bacterium]